MLGWLFCKLGGCWRCVVYETDEGVGGKCVRCGRVHGWTTRAALRRYLDSEG